MKSIGTTESYLAALAELGLQPASRATAAALGLSVRQCQRIAAGAPRAIPGPIGRLLAMYLRYGLPASIDCPAAIASSKVRARKASAPPAMVR